MPRKKNEVIRILQKKGFTLDTKRDHKYFYLYNTDGKRTTVNTKISHGSSKDIPDGLLNEMRRQIHLSKDEFDRYMDCTLSKDDYLQILKSIGKYY